MSSAVATDRVVLVVDDDLEIRESVRWFLEDEGLTVETAADGQQALDQATRARPALVVLDMGLPILTGEEVAAGLQAAYAEPPPILVMTAAGRAADAARRVGAYAYLDKPFDLDDLAEKVWRALGRP
jgi:two-component system alkaline phosphatase synthesis response regulator PhoP